MVKDKFSARRRDLVNLALWLVVIVLLNIIGQYIFTRFDLTSEKRYSLSEPTKKLLSDLKSNVQFNIYLEGDLTPQYDRLKEETKEMLDEFRAYAGENVQYAFVDPNAIPNKKDKDALFRELRDNGLLPVPSRQKKTGGYQVNVVFPGAIAQSGTRRIGIPFIKDKANPTEADVNGSVRDLEYELSNAIRKLQIETKDNIAFLEGHGELDSIFVSEISRDLTQYYNVERVALNGNFRALKGGSEGLYNKYKLVVIAKPDSTFSEKDVFILDQFVMNGGRILWLVDPVYTPLDSLARMGRTMGFRNEMNLDNILAKYGARINYNLVEDFQCTKIPVNKAFAGTPPRFEPEPWMFNPAIKSRSKHPIVNNLDLIRFEFASTIDTLTTRNRNIKKTILLETSRNSKIYQTPVDIYLQKVMVKPNPAQYTDSYQAVSVLLEGEFESLYRNHPDLAALRESKEIGYKEQSLNTKMIVVSDGDVIKNPFFRGRAFPLGYDVYEKKMYANRTFIMNCINYLCDDVGLLSARAREVKLRLLDKKKVEKDRFRWQMINIITPVGSIILFGVIWFVLRKRRYGQKNI